MAKHLVEAMVVWKAALKAAMKVGHWASTMAAYSAGGTAVPKAGQKVENSAFVMVAQTAAPMAVTTVVLMVDVLVVN